jgi:hypothetical protein
VANEQDDDREQESACTGTRGHCDATDTPSHTAAGLDGERRAKQQDKRCVSD